MYIILYFKKYLSVFQGHLKTFRLCRLQFTGLDKILGSSVSIQLLSWVWGSAVLEVALLSLGLIHQAALLQIL